jgi:hypothetical protein
MSIFEMAKAYYPEKWNKEMIRNLTARGRLTPEQYEEITGEPYAA